MASKSELFQQALQTVELITPECTPMSPIPPSDLSSGNELVFKETMFETKKMRVFSFICEEIIKMFCSKLFACLFADKLFQLTLFDTRFVLSDEKGSKKKFETLTHRISDYDKIS